MNPRVKLLAVSGLSLCIQQRCVLGNLDPVYQLYPRIGRRHLPQRGPPCIDVPVYIPLGILHGETAWWLTSSMNGRASSYLYKHLQQTNMMHHKRPCGQQCVPKPVALAMPCYRCHAATTSLLKISTSKELEVPVHCPNIATMAAGRTRLPASIVGASTKMRELHWS